MKYHLVVIPDKKTWSKKTTNLLLTEWCRPYKSDHLVSNQQKFSVAEPYGMSKPQRDEDHDNARRIEAMILPLACPLLNETHHTNYSQRFWEKIIGFWLRHHINVVTNRYKSMMQVLGSYEIVSVAFYQNPAYSLATKDYDQYIWALNNCAWNSKIYEILFSFIPSTAIIERKEISYAGEQQYFSDRQYIKRRPIRDALTSALLATSFLVKDSDAFYINSLLPKLTEALVRLSKLEWPVMWRRPAFTCDNLVNNSLRQMLAAKLDESLPATADPIYRAVSRLFFQCLPMAHLEHFTALSTIVSRQKWPRCPKFIFASANFDSDEVFKMYVAEMTEKGIPYYTGQHGSYGHTRHELNPSVEENTADIFLTWGWSEKEYHHAPVGCFKFAGAKKPKSKRTGQNIMLVQTAAGSLFTTYDRVFSHKQYFDDQLKFVETLTPENRARLRIRLLSVGDLYGFHEKERWMEFDKKIRFEQSGKPIFRILADFRLIVNSYDSTAILELLYFNMPTVAFWRNPFDHLRENAVPHYQVLVDAGILFASPSDCAQFINKNYADLKQWWRSDEVQQARLSFVSRYAKEIKSPIRSMRRLLYHDLKARFAGRRTA